MSDSYFPTDSLNAMNVDVSVADAVSGEDKDVKLGELLHGYVIADEDNKLKGFTDDSKNLSILTGESLPDYSEANDGDVLQIASGEPTWGAVDALPEITNADEGKVLTVVDNSGTLEAGWAEPNAIGNQCSVGSILSTALNVMVGSLVQQSIQSSATKYQHVALSAPLNDYLPDAMSIRQAVKKCVTDGVAATLSIFGQSVVLQTYGIGESNSTPEYTVCGTVPAYGMTVPQVGYYQFRIIVTIGFVIDDSDNISSGFYEVTVEPVVTPSTT